MNSTNERIKCPYCLSKNVTVIRDKEAINRFHGLCSDCGKQFTGYASPVDTTIEYEIPQPKECEFGEARCSSESYEQEIDHLKRENARLFTAVENLNNTIRILIENIRKGA